MNPLYTNNFKFFLNFKNEGSFGRVEITEPVKFDGANYVLKQKDKEYGRDVSFMNDSINLEFYNGVYEPTETTQVLPNGSVVNNLTMGLDYLLETYKIYGFEAEVDFIIQKGGVDFILGELDFQNAETDEVYKFACKAVQNKATQIIKRRDDIVVDVFSNEDVDGNAITPLTTTNILLKAKPEQQISEWNATPISAFFNNDLGFINPTIWINNPYRSVVKSDIENTIVPFSPTDFIVDTGAATNVKKHNFGYVDAITSLSNITMSGDLTVSYFIPTDEDISDGWGANPVNNVRLEAFKALTNSPEDDLTLILSSNIDMGTPTFVGVENINRFDFSFTGNAKRYDYTFSFDKNLVNFQNSERLVFYFLHKRDFTIVENKSGSLTIDTTSTAIDSVIKGVRYIDVMKQTTKSISGLTVDAHKFDLGGKYYNQFAFTGNLIKGRDTLPFPVKHKDIFGTTEEVNADNQVLDNSIYVGQYSDFYANNEIGVLNVNPDESSKITFNNRFAINQFEFNYKTFEQDRDESNTIDSVHTQTQWTPPNKLVENIKKIELLQIRDPFTIETARKDALKSTTSTSNDDKLFLIDVVDLAPNARGGFTTGLTHNIDADGNLQLLNDSSFRWDLLGFGVGSDFVLLNTSNAGTYSVIEITSNIITLSGSPNNNSGGAPTLTQVDYPFDNVQYTNRTNEGFQVIQNLLNSDKFSNLLYTTKRNIKEWYNYLATVCIFKQNGVFRNSFFKNNGALVTRFQGEDENTTENANVNVSDLGTPILTAKEYELTLVADFDNIVSLLNAVKTVNPDGTIGGFIRAIDNNGKVIKGYPKQLEYNPSSETLKATLEERNEGNNVVITTTNGLTINEVGYNIDTSLTWFEITNDYLVIYDFNNMPIINPTRYDFVIVDGIVYTSAILLSEKLITIL